ncbi:hypothetical protein DTO164E3_29 [Paecilomyces variotii]|nr:hypothetical protein DTO032I3_3078 [Paecilomyces variotii]KAJ9207743.1 hypothetical protein DTO164E3_29 [Paecilomyces variotii]KAJ9227563.1 hypothetical protein DTO169C6_204 [Paecilomyces variotii]KAJ9280672.1 hypothetical protein DTO021D3_2522 [Paecilomyces variotii]KAJ9303324.1 hypothetical protein DTO217A2_7199 [Paecilomyces variotii]
MMMMIISSIIVAITIGLFVVVSEPIAVTAHKTRVHYYYYVMDASSKREYIKSAPPLFVVSWKSSKYGC